jgi:hypothetical protein
MKGKENRRMTKLTRFYNFMKSYCKRNSAHKVKHNSLLFHIINQTDIPIRIEVYQKDGAFHVDCDIYLS